MPRRFSDVVGVTSEELWREGAFDSFVDIDARFHIDPHLLEKTTVPELQGAYERFLNHFKEVLVLLAHSKTPGDYFYKQARSRLHFPEFRFISLGYSKGERKNKGKGKGIGPVMAEKLTAIAAEIASAGISDPVIFELVGLLEEGIGADRISDMITRIIAKDLLRFTERVCRNLEIRTWPTTYKDEHFRVPIEPERREPIVFVPHEILRPLPIAFDWTDLDRVTVYNGRLRKAVNDDIGLTWKDATDTKKVSKEELKDILIEDLDLLGDLMEQYKAKPASQYDYKRDPEGGLVWYQLAEEWAQKYPALLDDVADVTPGKIHEVVIRICRQFGLLLTHHGLNAHLYNDDDHFRKEGYARLLFYGIADAYCRANNLDLSLEPKWGKEMVMFKISRGMKARVFVAVKYSRNGHLVEQYKTAVDDYYQQEGQTIFLVIQTAESQDVRAALEKIRFEAGEARKPIPELLIFDGRKTDITRGRLWEFGLADENHEAELVESETIINADEPSSLLPIPSNGHPKQSDEPLGIRAKRLGIRPKRLKRWDKIYSYSLDGLTQEQMAEREDVAVRTIKSDFRGMKEKGIFPLAK